MPPLFSAIVATHNRPELLGEALASVRSQTVTDFECIVVDDGSSEPPNLPDDSRFWLLHSDAQIGLPAASNLALNRAKGSFVTFLDDDDVWAPGRLQFALQGLEHAPVAICWRADHATRVAGRNRMLFGNVHDVILERSIPTKGQVAVARDCMHPFDPRLITASDVEWWLRASAATNVHTVDQVGLYVRRHPGQRNSARLAERIRCRRLIFDIHRGYFERRPAIAASFLYRTARIAQWSGRHREAITLLSKSLAHQPSGRATARLLLSLVRHATSIRVPSRNVETVADQFLPHPPGSIEQTAD